ncbi:MULTISPECIES: MauE/DoxX family redox-associated membrane protein [Sphingobacterium]|uniref:MauE/DoxX family redox-associated membrane protein n=1 Tax=Sphingobacterium TaxID=28453 RepID=UPI000E839DBB|nr:MULTISPECIES: MauE/DoxX family redox-associated membrane protein [Sphingobacterium]HAU54327.1 hypothetical protein [Sphingobacterium sp.]HCX63464.1 hypothetical protein [Clostridiales bacterium]
MKTKVFHITSCSTDIFMLLFWLYAAVDTLLHLPEFHASLLDQPFPSWWADMLFLMLPVVELGIGILFAIRFFKRYKPLLINPYLLSIILLTIFTVYTDLGASGLYKQKPCGYASVFSGLSWGWHLIINLVLIFVSILGWYLNGPTTPMVRCKQYEKKMLYAVNWIITTKVSTYSVLLRRVKKIRMRFALFPAGPVKA